MCFTHEHLFYIVGRKGDKTITLRIVKGVPGIIEYLKSHGVELSTSTVSRLIREEEMPFKRIDTQILLFDLDKIDKWIVGDDYQ